MSDNLLNPYHSPLAEGNSTMHRQSGTLIASGWLYRKVQLPPPMNCVIEYNGRGLGFETVSVNGQIAARQTSLVWFVPHFECVVPTESGNLVTAVDVRVAPWLTLTSITISIDGNVVYAES